MDRLDYQDLYQEEYGQSVQDAPGSYHRQWRERSAFLNGLGAEPMSNVIDMLGSNNRVFEVMVIEPSSFEEMLQVIQLLREKKVVILNLNYMDPEQAQRAVDFSVGGIYAIDGQQQRISEGIFLFTPNCVQINTQPTGNSHFYGEPPQPQTTYGHSFVLR